jgi:hypothetical protein
VTSTSTRLGSICFTYAIRGYSFLIRRTPTRRSGFVGFRISELEIRLTQARLSCLDCKRETHAGYFRTGYYFDSGESSPRLKHLPSSG